MAWLVGALAKIGEAVVSAIGVALTGWIIRKSEAWA